MKQGNKRGLLLNQIIEIIFAVIIIVILIFSVQRIFSTYYGNTKKLQAKGTLESIVNKLNSLKEGETVSYLLQAPSGWHLVYFNASSNINNNFKKPQKFFGQDLLCVCYKNCEICQTIKKPFMQGGVPVNLKIQLMDLWLSDVLTYYNLSRTEVTIAPSLSDEEKADILLKSRTTKDTISPYGGLIREAAKKHYPSVKDYIANQNEFEILIKAIISIESQGSWSAIGTSGEVGLMQLMPQVALNYGLRIYDPEDKIKNAKDKWNDELLNYLRNDYLIQLKSLKTNKEKGELILIDERFNEEKNIEVGVNHLTSYIVQFKSKDFGIMAYNTGSKKIEENCKPMTVIACNKDFVGIKYLQKVKASVEALS